MIVFSKLISFLRFSTSSVLGEFYDEGQIDTALTLRRELNEDGFIGKYIF